MTRQHRRGRQGPATGRLRRTGAATALLLGAVVLALLRGAADVTFNATPLLIGLIVLAGAAWRGARGSWGAGLVLVCWGTAVLLVREGPLPPGREAAAFLLAGGLGLLLAAAVTPREHRADALTGGALTLAYGGLAFYLAYDLGWLLGWPFWSLMLALWGLWELRRPVR